MSEFLRTFPGRASIHNEDFCSIAIVSFNRHDRLKRLIDSIHKHADMPFELVVSDDGGLLYDNYDFISEIKDKVSHVAVNLGRNKGLHVNANTAVSLTRSKNVILLYDDVEVLAPFMRRTTDLLNSAPYVGTVYLGHSYNENGLKSDVDSAGIISCTNPQAGHYSLLCKHGGGWAIGFRKSYWYEVGGYSEYSIYGDMPFINKGWKLGYFSCILSGSRLANDMDKDAKGRTHDSSGRFIKVGYTNYPKIFGVPDSKLIKWDRQRASVCAGANHHGRTTKFNDYDCDSWSDYMETVTKTGKIDWDILKNGHHGRFIDDLKKHIHSHYPEE